MGEHARETASPPDVILTLEDEARRRVAQMGLSQLEEKITLRWHPRLRTTAGQARASECMILLNPRLSGFPGELMRTFLHELAHLVAHARHPRRRISPHGAEWRAACADLGLPGEKRCHNLSLAAPRRVVRRHTYHCPCCRREVARVRPFRRGEACLACCRTHSGGRYNKRFRFVAGPPPADGEILHQAELFQF